MGAAARESKGMARQATTRANVATGFCVFAFTIDARIETSGKIRYPLGYRKLGGGCEYLVTVLICNFYTNRVLAGDQVFERQKLFDGHLAGRGPRNLRELLGEGENLLIGAVFYHLV